MSVIRQALRGLWRAVRDLARDTQER